MAYEYLTMLDLAKINAGDQTVGLIEENLNIAPEAKMFPARTNAGISYNTLIRTALPGGAFRKVNVGNAPTKSKYANKLVECFYYDGQLEMDVAAADADDQGPDHALALEADGHMQACLQVIGKQVWYGNAAGNGGDTDGFPGAVQIVDPGFVVDAGGTTASTGSSVYGVKLGEKWVQLVFGKNSIPTIGEWRQQSITRSSTEMLAWKNQLSGWVGCQWVNKNAVCRIKKLTADAGKGLTDALLGSVLSKLPTGADPDVWFMTKRSREQLRASRTATNPTGTPAPLPTDAFGIPIVVTDSILNTEALTL